MFQAAILAASLMAAPAPAVHFKAEPVSPPAQSKLVVRDTLWRCGEGSCFGGTSGSRPAIVCALLAKEVGPLRSFHVAGQPLAQPALDACNARAN